MSEIIMPGHYDEKEIRIDTREGNHIENAQLLALSEFTKNQFQLFKNRYPDAKPRSNPTGIFNCHGLTFASRRTVISDIKEVSKILREDKYVVIDRLKTLPGDIIVYYNDGDIEHSGIVVSETEPPLYVPLICSKWGAYAEVLHWANYGPYAKHQIKYYRIFE